MPPEKQDDIADDVLAAMNELKAADASADDGQDSAALADVDPVDADATDDDAAFQKRAAAAKGGAETEEDADGEGEEDGGDQDAGAADDTSAGDIAPPPSWTVKSKAAWDKLPAEVKADIAKREREVSNGFAELRDYKDLKPFAELARKHSTTIAKSLERYVGMETLLRKDFGRGLAQITQNYGYNQQQAAQLFAQLAAHFGGQPQTRQSAQPAPTNGQPGTAPKPGDPLYEILRPILEPLQNEVRSLKTNLNSQAEANRNASQQTLEKTITAFAARPENRYFVDLEETISRLFETGFVPLTGNHEGDLRAAYDLATQMVPTVRDALIEQRISTQTDAARKREQDALAKAKRSSRSINGSRMPGTTIERNRQTSSLDDDVEADVRAAMQMHSQQ